jgi:hypothetical protein
MVWAYFAKPEGAIRAAGRIRDLPHWIEDWGRWAIWIDWDKALTESLGRQPIRYEEFQQPVQASVMEANSTTRRLLISRLERHQSQPERERDMVVRFIGRQVQSRLGQGDFRQSLLRAYNNRCAVTDCNIETVLQAAHIRSVGDGGTHAVTNGLLLRADIHNLFDRGLIWIDSKLIVRVAQRIDDPDYRRYHGVPLHVPSASSDRPSKAALQRHRSIHQR